MRRGWYLGDETFRDKVLATLDGAVSAMRRRGSLRGEAARAHDEAEAERLAKSGLVALGLPDAAESLAGHGRWMDAKTVLATLIRRRTGVRNAWVASRLAMGTEGNVTRALHRVRTERRLARRLKMLEQMLELRDPFGWR